MVAAGCAGIRALREGRADIPLTIVCQPEWENLAKCELPGAEVRVEPL
jgi:hypothetical protein